MKLVSRVAAGYAAICRKVYVLNKEKAILSAMLLGGVALLSFGVVEASHAQLSFGNLTDDKIQNVGNLILSGLIEGTFGALIMVVAGLVAIIAAAMGAYRAAMACLIVAVGCFILRTFVEIFFGQIY